MEMIVEFTIGPHHSNNISPAALKARWIEAVPRTMQHFFFPCKQLPLRSFRGQNAKKMTIVPVMITGIRNIS
jgi:hypothetical protein